MKKNSQNKLILFSLISINLLLFSLISSLLYISYKGKEQLVNQVKSISDVAKREIVKVEGINKSLSDLAKSAKQINVNELKETSEKFVSEIVNKFEGIKKVLEEKIKELSSSVGEKLNLSELSGGLNNIEKNLEYLKGLKEIGDNLSSLKDINGGIDNLKNSLSGLSSLDSLEGIKGEIKVVGDGINAVNSKINSENWEELGRGIGSKIIIDNDKISQRAKEAIKEALEKELLGLNSDITQTLKDELERSTKKHFCLVCENLKPFDLTGPSDSVFGKLTNKKVSFLVLVEKSEWIKSIKKGVSPLKVRCSNGMNWTEPKKLTEIKKENSIALSAARLPFIRENKFNLDDAIKELEKDLSSNEPKYKVQFIEEKCSCGNKFEFKELKNTSLCLKSILEIKN